MGVVFAYIGGQWLACIADAYGQSEQEWNLILEERREQQSASGRKRIAQFLRQLEQDEALRLQRQRDLEEQTQHVAALSRTEFQGVPNDSPPHVEMDLTRSRRYGEYTNGV